MAKNFHSVAPRDPRQALQRRLELRHVVCSEREDLRAYHGRGVGRRHRRYMTVSLIAGERACLTTRGLRDDLFESHHSISIENYPREVAITRSPRVASPPLEYIRR